MKEYTMAKKKRKNFIKLNNKIKTLFNNRPFDEVVAELDDDILYGILMLINESPKSLDRDDIIKYLRRIWSEGDYSIRKVIVDFIEDQFTYKKNNKNDKVDLILSFLEDVDTTSQEDEQILAEFIDKKIAKITKDKILNKLAYIRMSKTLDRYSKELDIHFIGNETIEFIAKHYLEIDNREIEINLIHTYKMDISLNSLVKLDYNEAIELLKRVKEKAIEEEKKNVEEFNKHILTIEYFDTKDLINTFKALKEPIRNLYHCPIPSNIVKKIIKHLDKDLEISYNAINYLISKEFSYNLYGEELKYDIYLDYDKTTLYGSIWTININTILDDLDTINNNAIEAFNHYIDDLYNKLVEHYAPLEVDEDKIKEYILRFIQPVIEANRSLKLKNKIAKRVLYHFNEDINL